jgi:hypothetical protein
MLKRKQFGRDFRMRMWGRLRVSDDIYQCLESGLRLTELADLRLFIHRCLL